MRAPNQLRVLLAGRHWLQYETFRRRFQAAAHDLALREGDQRLARLTVGERQYHRWVYGGLAGQPRPDACRVLEHLTGHPVAELFATTPASTHNPHPPVTQPPATVHSEKDMVMAAARESADFAAFAEGSNVGPHTLDQLRADIERIVLTYPNRPVLPTFAEVREVRDRAFELLEGHQPPAYTRDLYLAAGLLCGILANACLDLGRLPAAETQARTAFLCAELAGHNGLRCWVRGMQSLIAYWDDRPHDAVALARDGWDYVPEAGTARVRVASIEARAQGRLQQEEAAQDAFHRAEQARQQVHSQDEPGGQLAFPVAKQLFYASTADLWLGGERRYQQAERAAADAVRQFEGEPREHRRLGELNLARLDLAAARLAQSDLEGFAEQAREVIRVSARRRTEPVTRRLRQLASRIELPPYSRSPAALSIREGDPLLHHTHPHTHPAGQ